MKIRMWIVAIIQFIPALLCLSSIKLTYILITQSATMILFLSWSAREYFLGAISFISTMYSLHRYEFKRHALRSILLSMFTMVTLIYVLFGVYFLIVVNSCYVSQQHMDSHRKQDLCFDILPTKFTPDLASESYFMFIIFELLPFTLYFILQRPHDCFVCLGKDPDRRFSMFQLTRRETQIREAQMKFGQGGFGMTGKLAPQYNLVGSDMDLDQSSSHNGVFDYFTGS